MSQIEVYFADLSFEQQKEIVEADEELSKLEWDYSDPGFVAKVESETNWDIVPLTIIEV